MSLEMTRSTYSSNRTVTSIRVGKKPGLFGKVVLIATTCHRSFDGDVAQWFGAGVRYSVPLLLEGVQDRRRFERHGRILVGIEFALTLKDHPDGFDMPVTVQDLAVSWRYFDRHY